MTRINVGIKPEELCDQHLVAEYRELPRVFGHNPKTAPPEAFRLGAGHVNWCAQYQGSLADRHREICDEMRHRAIAVNYPPAVIDGHRWTAADKHMARPILQERIRDRLSTMKRKPTWRNRCAPEWAICAGRAR